MGEKAIERLGSQPGRDSSADLRCRPREEELSQRGDFAAALSQGRHVEAYSV